MTLEQALAEWANTLRWEGRRPSTRETYERAGRQLLGWCKDRDVIELSEVSVSILREFFHWMTETRSASTARQRRLSLGVFFHFCVDEGWLTSNPLDRVKAPSVPDRPIPLLTESQFRLLLSGCSARTFTGARNRALLWLLWTTGLRASEVAAIKSLDLNWAEDSVTVEGKGGKVRVVQHTVDAGSALNAYRKLRVDHPHAASPYFFLGKQGPMTRSGLGQMLKKLGENVGVEGVHPHRFRHTLAHRWLMEGGTEGGLLAFMGWSEGSRSMLDRYGRAGRQQRSLSEYRRLFDYRFP